MATTRSYTSRFSESEFSDINRVAVEQGVPISRVIRLGLLYLYAHLGDKQAFDNVGDVSLLLKEKVMEEMKQIPNGMYRLKQP
jgi:hypothetical protein